MDTMESSSSHSLNSLFKDAQEETSKNVNEARGSLSVPVKNKDS